MAEETRRSARATKGQNSKLYPIELNLEPKKKGKRAKKATQVSEEPTEVIRCICGATETGDDDKDPWIACDGCDVWQHNICMGISSYGEDVPEQYFCEQCHPEDHKELLSSIKRGEDLWNERRKIYEIEQAEYLNEEGITKKKSKKKGRKLSDVASENATNGKLVTTPVAAEKKLPQKSSSTKRKTRDESHDNEPLKESQPKIRKLSSVPTPHQGSPKINLSMRALDIDSTRQGAAKMLLKGLLHSIQSIIKSGTYTLGYNETLELLAENLAVAVENAVHTTHPDMAAYAKQSRTIASNLKHNLELSEGLLAKTLLPQALATMSSDDMASKELKKEKQEMKARADKQSIMITDDEVPRVRRTHKGEELVEGDSFTVPDDITKSSPRRRSTIEPIPEVRTKSREVSPSDRLDVTAETNNIKSTDISSQVIAKQIHNSPTSASPTKKTPNQQGFDINKVFDSVQSPVLPKNRRASINTALPVNGPGEDPEIDQLLQDDSTESPPYSPAEYNSDPSIIWRGTVTMESVAEFPAVAKHIGGVDITQSLTSIQWSDVLAKDLKIAGRIDHEKANEYLCSLRYSPPTDLVVVNVSSTGESHSQAFTDLYDYFQSKNRYGVLTNKGIGNIRDTYLVPVPPNPGPLPDFIVNLEGHKIPEYRTEPLVIIALVIRNDWQPAAEHQYSHRGLDGSDKQTTAQLHQRSMSLSGTTGPQMSPIGPPNSFHSQYHNFRPDELQREIDQRTGEEAAKRILGDHVKAPTVAFLMPQAYQMRETEWNLICDILREDEKARGDLQHLSVVLEQRMAGTS